MKKNEGVTAEDVRYAYRMLLGREAETDEVVEFHQRTSFSIDELREHFMNGEEFKNIIHSSEFHLRRNVPKRPITSFGFDELNKRIRAVDTGKIFDIANSSEVKSFALESLQLEDINDYICRFNLQDGNSIYECLLCDSNTKKLYVCLSDSGDIDTLERRQRPEFEGLTWCEFMDGIVLFIEDPMAKRFPGVQWGGYLGDSEVFYVEGIAEIVKKISALYSIPAEKIIFIGRSSAGFASCYACALVPGSRCMAENPSFYPGKTIIKMEEWKHTTGYDLRLEKYSSRLAVDKVIRNSNNIYQLFFNRASALDYKNRLLPFLEEAGIENVSDQNYIRIGNIDIYIMDANAVEGGDRHCNFLSPLGLLMAEHLLDMDEKTRAFLVNAYVKANRVRHALLEQLS